MPRKKSHKQTKPRDTVGVSINLPTEWAERVEIMAKAQNRNRSNFLFNAIMKLWEEFDRK